VFEARALRLEDDWLTFYIKPEDGLKLPNEAVPKPCAFSAQAISFGTGSDIMKWMKRVFAQRFNAAAGRIGHIWGDRYWSRILEREPEEGAGEAANGDRPRRRRKERKSRFSLKNPSPAAPSPG
jgi:hypothetical protein